MSSMPLSVQKEMAHDVVSNCDSAFIILESKCNIPSSLFSEVSFQGDLFVKLRPNFWSKYRYCSSWGAAEDSEISMKDIILNNSQDDGIKLHPLISNAMSNIMPSGAESRVKTKKLKSNKINKSVVVKCPPPAYEENDEATLKIMSSFSNGPSRSICNIFYDKDPKGRKLGSPVLYIIEDYVGLATDIIKTINFYGESSARGICPVSWPAIELNDTVVLISSIMKNRALSYLIPVMNMIKAKLPESQLNRTSKLSCLMICSSFKTCLKFEEYCHFICPHVKVISIYHSKELDGNTHAEILNGCDIIIATPLSLLRHLANNAINLDSLDTLIFEDGNLLPLFKTFYHEINQVMKSLSNYDLRIIVSSNCWSDELKVFNDSYLVTENNPMPTVITDAPLEAAIYGGVQLSIFHLSNISLKVNKLVELLKAKCSHRTVVFASKHDFDTLYETLISSSETIIAISKKRANMSQEGVLKMWFGNEASFVTLLITDEMLIYVIEEIYNADCIIHFNLPHQSRTEFQLRFMLMRDNFKRYKCDRKQTTCHIFVDDQNDQGLKYIYQFLLRVKNNKITDVISKNSPEYDQLIAYFKNSISSLCFNFKWRGSCGVKNMCPFRHRFDPKLDQIFHPFFPTEGIISFTVGGLHEDYPLEMNIKIKKLKSENQICDFEKSNLELMEELKGVDTRGLSLIIKPEPDTLYLFKHKVNDLRRIRTIPRNGQHVIQFYDLDGNEDVIDFDEDQHILYECPSHIANENKYPRSRAQIVFIGVKPLDKDSEWCRVIRDTILDAVCTTNSGGQTLTPQISGRIVLRIGYTFWLSELEILNETLESGIHQSKVQLLKKNIFLSKQMPLVEHDEVSLNSFYKIAEFFKDHHQYDSHDSSLSIENRIESDKDLDYENLMPMTSAFFNDPYEEVVISNLESPDSFYVQRIKFLDLLTSLEDDIEADVIQNKFIFQNGSNYRKGDLILAKYNGKFRRGKILDSNVEIQILYVDYGTISIVHRSDIIPYNSYILDYFNRLPCQAIKCHLHNVSPIGIEWYVECLDYLNYEVMSYEKIICEIRSTSPEDSFGYSVALFIPDEQNNGIFVCLAQYLYECEYCEIIDATQYCSQTLNYFNTDGFNSDLSSDEGDHVQPPSLNAISAGDQIITSDVNLFSSSNDGMEIKLPEFIKWYESCSELFLTVSWKLIYDAPINPNSLYIRIDKYSVFIRYMEKDSIMHETPIPLILNDLVKPSKTSVVYGKGRSFKLVLVKKSKKIWNAALFSGLSFQWITFDFDRNPEKSHKSNSPLPIDKKAHIAFPEAYFDHSGSEESDEYASSVESLD
ncbi:putative ATP-dependent RNA helicase TDRD12 isoform X2 [Lepeophtheirus salmonis]|nr:uncharacterized protein LOC121116895 isoform X2 [Lepeophtheirus salmonis]